MPYEAPKFLFKNVLEDGITTATSEKGGSPIENLFDGFTWTFWIPKTIATQNIDSDMGAPGTFMDSFAMLSHDIGTQGGTISIFEADNAGFAGATLLGTITPADDGHFLLDLDPDAGLQFKRIQITGLTGVCFIGVIVLGQKMVIPVGPKHTKFDPDRQKSFAEKHLNFNGQLLNTTVKFSDRRPPLVFRNIPQSFVASDLKPFLNNFFKILKPFFLQIDPGNVYGTDELFYLIAPNNPDVDIPVEPTNPEERRWEMKAEGVNQEDD